MTSGFVRPALTAGAMAAIFAASWFLRFNDPDGAFAGLTDDHFFYVVRGWQILFGDLPVRDFVDHGAPLHYYVAAAVQTAFGRGTLSEVLFSVTMLSAGAALTLWLAARASGSLLLGVLAALFQIALAPRFYNYPKIIVYAVAIPLLWWFAERPAAPARLTLAFWTVVAFLFRHDHGIFVAIATVAVALARGDMTWRQRARQIGLYAGAAFAMILPYLVFIQIHEGLGTYVSNVASWADKDRSRAPVLWPGPFDEPGGIRENLVAWIYYVELTLPLVALGLIAVSRHAFRPAWPRAVPKMIVVAVLALLLNAGFLRSPLAARIADPSVPHAILIAWLVAATLAVLRSRDGLAPALRPYAIPIRGVALIVVAAIAWLLGPALGQQLTLRAGKAFLIPAPAEAVDRAAAVARQLEDEWHLANWAGREDRPELFDLVFYLDACTKPEDRVFVQPYFPQVLALARRAFAGGHADLRPGFFDAPDTQQVTLERMRRQSVPVALLETGDSYRNFRKAFPQIADHFDREYTLGGTHRFDRRFEVQLLVRRDRTAVRRYAPLGWPCFR